MASLSNPSKWRKQLVSVDEYLCVALDEIRIGYESLAAGCGDGSC